MQTKEKEGNREEISKIENINTKCADVVCFQLFVENENLVMKIKQYVTTYCW